MSATQIECAIVEAYRGAKKLANQGERILVEGTTSSGMKIEMWVYKMKRLIETAYPK